MTWTLVQTHPAAERRASASLVARGVPHLIVWVEQRAINRGRLVECAIPAFPTYVFVPLDSLSTRGFDVVWTPGIARIVMFGRSRPVELSDDLITDLRHRLDANGCLVWLDQHRGVKLEQIERFLPGQRVRITKGAAAGWDAIYECRTSTDRVRVLLALIGGGAVPVNVNELHLEEATEIAPSGPYRHRRRPSGETAAALHA